LNYFDEYKNKVLDLKRMKGGEPKLLVEDKKDETEPKFASWTKKRTEEAKNRVHEMLQ
jgi:hypothetical protein